MKEQQPVPMMSKEMGIQQLIKELGEVIPKPDNQFHYELSGEYLPNQNKYRVAEEGAVSEYTFPDKTDMGKVQFVSRNTYTKELNMWGTMKEKPVKFDTKTGKWKKLNLFENIKAAFHKADHIPAQVVDGVLHTLEEKRPIGKTVHEAKISTLSDAKVEIGLRYKHLENQLRDLTETNYALEQTINSQKATIRAQSAQLIAANLQSYEQPTASTYYTQTRRDEPPSYGNIAPSGETPKKSKPVDRTPPKKNEKLDKRGDDLMGKYERNAELRNKTAQEVNKWLAAQSSKDQVKAREVTLYLEDGSILYAARKTSDTSEKVNIGKKNVQVNGESRSREAVVLEVREDCTARDLAQNMQLLDTLYQARTSVSNDRLFTANMLSRSNIQDNSIGRFPMV